jgi:hypothetical protein
LFNDPDKFMALLAQTWPNNPNLFKWF